MPIHRKFNRLAIAASALFLASSVSIATADEAMPTTAGEPATVAASDADNLISCRRYDTSGSRVRKEKVCMTAKRWKEQEEQAESFGKNMQDGHSAQPGGQSLQGN